MSKRKQKRPRVFVIDADIARAVTNGEKPTPSACRQVLLVIRDQGHSVATSPTHTAEWSRHQTPFARTWLRTMTIQRQVVRWKTDPEVGIGPIVERIQSDSRRRATQKDDHLLSLAIATDRRIVSMDEKACANFALLVAHDARIGTVHFVNPIENTSGVLDWLERGAPDESARCIGQRPAREA